MVSAFAECELVWLCNQRQLLLDGVRTWVFPQFCAHEVLDTYAQVKVLAALAILGADLHGPANYITHGCWSAVCEVMSLQSGGQLLCCSLIPTDLRVATAGLAARACTGRAATEDFIARAILYV